MGPFSNYRKSAAMGRLRRVATNTCGSIIPVRLIS